MQIDLQKILNYLLIILAVLAGLVFGAMGSRMIDLSLDDGVTTSSVSRTRQSTARVLQEADFQIILKRNLFNSEAVGDSVDLVDLSAGPLKQAVAEESTAPVKDLRLLGTVVAGDESLALIRVGNKATVFRIGDEIASRVVLSEVLRKVVVILDRGQRKELPLLKQKGSQARRVSRKGKTTTGDEGIVPIEEGRWKISRSVAQNARTNLNALLRTARVVPEIKNGATVGFKLVELQKGSLLEKVGLQVGDLIVEINQVELNSPEKALQIFQQVREASNLSLGLLRNGQPRTFEYRFE